MCFNNMASNNEDIRNKTVVIVGAGISGLYAARCLLVSGYRPIILEASARGGGRILTEDGIDLGGTYVGNGHTRIHQLIQEYGLRCVDVEEKGDLLLFRRGLSTPFKDAFLPPMTSVASFMDACHVFRELDRLAATVPPDRPWDAPQATHWDKITFHEWCRRQLWTSEAVQLAGDFVRLNTGMEPWAVSLLWVLLFLKQNGGCRRTNATAGGAQEKKIVGGAYQVVTNLAKEVGAENIHLNCPVNRIEQDDNGVKVYSGSQVFEGCQVILCTTPVAQFSIEFVPQLPANRLQLCNRILMGSVIKTIAIYDRPYWREKGLSGTVVLDDRSLEHPTVGIFDDSLPDGRSILLGFINGEKAQYMSRLTTHQRQQIVCKSYAHIFNIPELEKPVSYIDKDWCSQPWIGGCYLEACGPGTLSELGRSIREPIGRIHFAGTAAATQWMGYMEGALQAAENAVNQICNKEPVPSTIITQKWKPAIQEDQWTGLIPSVGRVVKTAGSSIAILSLAAYLKHKL